MNDWSYHFIWFPHIILVPVASFLYHRHVYRVVDSEVRHTSDLVNTLSDSLNILVA